MYLFNKYGGSFLDAEKTVAGLPVVPIGMVKIFMSLKVLTDLIGVLLILVILAAAIDWLR